jgi:hypothetical protein
VLLASIALHVIAVLLHYVVKRDDLILPMFHGRTTGEGARDLRFRSSGVALAVLGACALAVWAVVALFGT